MKFEIGDRVLVLHSNEEGEIVDIINDKMVLVNVRGVKFPAYADQLDFPYFRQFSQKKQFPEKKNKKFIDQVPVEKNSGKPRVADGMWLTLLPVFDTDEFGDDVVEEFKIHLANNTHTACHFTYNLQYAGKENFTLENDIHPFQDFYIHDLPFENLNDNPAFNIEFALLVPDKKKATHFESQTKLKAKQIFARTEIMKKKGEATISFLLFPVYPDKPEEEKSDLSLLDAKGYKIYDASRARQNLEPAEHELDLHIEKLAANWRDLDNFEMLTLQLQTFDKYFELAQAHHLPSMVVIHGIGTGKLRDEIHESLKLKKGVKYFVNQYDARYGYGATEIFFQY